MCPPRWIRDLRDFFYGVKQVFKLQSYSSERWGRRAKTKKIVGFGTLFYIFYLFSIDRSNSCWYAKFLFCLTLTDSIWLNFIDIITNFSSLMKIIEIENLHRFCNQFFSISVRAHLTTFFEFLRKHFLIPKFFSLCLNVKPNHCCYRSARTCWDSFFIYFLSRNPLWVEHRKEIRKMYEALNSLKRKI